MYDKKKKKKMLEVMFEELLDDANFHREPLCCESCNEDLPLGCFNKKAFIESNGTLICKNCYH